MKTFRELPKEIQEKMLEEQVLQGNERDAEVFETHIKCGKPIGGFNWWESTQGHNFWSKILVDNDFTEFYRMYPKKTAYPKVMWVSEEKNFFDKRKRVVFTKKCGKYLAWNNAQTIEDAENETKVITWSFAKGIEPTIKLTKQKIADEFGIDIENLEII